MERQESFLVCFFKIIFYLKHKCSYIFYLIGLFEYVVFCRIKRKNQIQILILFSSIILLIFNINFVMNQKKRISKHMKLGLIVCNEIIGLLIKSLGKNEELMIINGIRQNYVKGEGFFVYRQKGSVSFFKYCLSQLRQNKI